MSTMVGELAQRASLSWFSYQLDCFDYVLGDRPEPLRLCLFYKTGAGKSITALACMALAGVDDVLVIAPPSTTDTWMAQGKKLGITVEVMSHAKFRMKDTKLSRDRAVIADEFHLFGGHTGKGWKKFDGLAKGLRAPLVLASATPNYNDAERVYCIQHVLDPHSVKGGYLQFLYTHCKTEQDPFSSHPKVLGFHHYPDAAAYLAALPGVMYLPDDLVYTIVDLPVEQRIPRVMVQFGINPRKGRLIASMIEEKHAIVDHTYTRSTGGLRTEVYEILAELAGQSTGPMLVFSNHSTVAEALAERLDHNEVVFGLITGKTTAKEKQRLLDLFRDNQLDVLVGTASLATGTDGLDKVCDLLVILDDTDDDALRRQLIGRIMTRGADTDATKKQVYRLRPT